MTRSSAAKALSNAASSDVISLWSGTCSSSTYLNGAGACGTPSGSTPSFPLTVAGTVNSGGIPYFNSTTQESSSALLTANSPVLGGGAGAAPFTASFLTTDGITQLNIGPQDTTNNGILGLKGKTSGTATITAPAVAGTSSNALTFSNVLSAPAGSATAPTFASSANSNTGMWFNGTNIDITNNGTNGFEFAFTQLRVGSTTTYGWCSVSTPGSCSDDTAFSRDSVGVVDLGTGASGSKAGSLNLTGLTATGTVSAALYATATNCSNSASPAVCLAAAAGSVALPTGTNPTLTVNTTAVTANSQILLNVDESLGTKLGVTCNTTLSTLLNPVVTARVAGTSFTFTIGAIIATNPACVSYEIKN